MKRFLQSLELVGATMTGPSLLLLLSIAICIDYLFQEDLDACPLWTRNASFLQDVTRFLTADGAFVLSESIPTRLDGAIFLTQNA